MGTSCDCDCDGKGTSVLALALSLLALALLALVVVEVPGAAREGKDGTWVAPFVLVVVVVVIVVVVVGVVQCLDGDTSLTEPSVVMIILAGVCDV